MMSEANRRTPWLLGLFTLQPILDVLSYWLNHFGLDHSVTLFLRFALLIATAGVGFHLSRRKKVYCRVGCVLLLFTLGHAAACMQVGYALPLEDLTNLIRIYLLPLTALSFMTFLETIPNAREQIHKGFFLCLLLIAFISLLSALTGTDPHTYPNKSIGLLGWFYFANCQSAILTMLVPASIIFVHKKWPGFWPLALISLGGFGLLFLLGTRLAYFGLILTGLLLGLCLLLGRDRKAGIWLLVLTLMFGALFPVSPMVKNQSLVAENAVLKQQQIDKLVAQDEAKAADLSEEVRSIRRLESAYEEYLPGLVEQFGLERTAEKYVYSDKASDIADVRRAKITYGKLLLEDSPPLSYAFGTELSRWTTRHGSYDVENDFHGIFFLCGGVGLLLLLLFLGYYVVLVLRGLIHRPKLLLDPEFVALCVGALSCAAHIYATAGVLRRPNASFYLAVILALLWNQVHTEKRKAGD